MLLQHRGYKPVNAPLQGLVWNNALVRNHIQPPGFEPQCVYGIYCPGGSFDLCHGWATTYLYDVDQSIASVYIYGIVL